jgi:hypothetical protein
MKEGLQKRKQEPRKIVATLQKCYLMSTDIK